MEKNRNLNTCKCNPNKVEEEKQRAVLGVRSVLLKTGVGGSPNNQAQLSQLQQRETRYYM